MSERLRQQQYALARHLRDPSRHAPPPGLEDRRLRIYRELFFGSIESLLAGSFPVLRQTLDESAWRTLVRAFYAEHRSATPLFTRIAAEFVDFVQGYPALDDSAPWLAELAHYEWVEIDLQLSDAALPAHRRDGDLLDSVLLLSPLAMPLGYRWPVDAIGPQFQPLAPPEQPTLLLVHRDAALQVRFARIAPMAYRLLTSLQTDARSGRAHLDALAQETGGDPASVQAQGLALLQRMREDSIVLCAQPEP
ncbi:HvfC family RiPP maturation protein [Pseudomonas sp. CGJS7]|uniref:HvfC family RiPP maturation protein n=1 Tax=Pseudomonas sp. CGJS7 TaxID=3109348 RepID=UPI00300BEE58